MKLKGTVILMLLVFSTFLMLGSATPANATTVTQPVRVCIQEAGAPPGTFTLSGGGVAPPTVTGSTTCSSYTNLTVNAVSTITLSAPSDGTYTRYRFNASSTATTSLTSAQVTSDQCTGFCTY